MISASQRLVLSLLAAATVPFFSACSDGPTDPAANPLAGLTQTERGDTATVPPPTTPATPGSFVGTILGYTPGTGGDTVGNAQKLAGVRVTAFVKTEVNGATTA